VWGLYGSYDYIAPQVYRISSTALSLGTTAEWIINPSLAFAVKYMWNRRDAQYPVIGDRTQTRATLGIFYTLLGHDRFGAYDWR
jgi:uncharacterized lipoprotein YddW (UPF0748 family)